MPVVYRPPPSGYLIERTGSMASLSPLGPRLLLPNKMRRAYTRLKVLIRRNILIMRARRDVIRETQAIEAVLEVHIQQSLIGSIKRDPALRHCIQRPVIPHVRSKHHQPGVEDIRPPNIRRRGERRLNGKQLVRSAPRHHVRVHVHDASELELFPERDFGEGRVQVDAVHQGEVLGLLVHHAVDGDDVVVDSLGFRALVYT